MTFPILKDKDCSTAHYLNSIWPQRSYAKKNPLIFLRDKENRNLVYLPNCQVMDSAELLWEDENGTSFWTETLCSHLKHL